MQNADSNCVHVVSLSNRTEPSWDISCGRHTTTNDNAIFEMRGLRGPSAAFEYMKDIFDAYYRLGMEEFPCALNYGIHPANGLMPERVSFQERFLDYMLEFKNVWFARCRDLADYWMKNYV